MSVYLLQSAVCSCHHKQPHRDDLFCYIYMFYCFFNRLLSVKSTMCTCIIACFSPAGWGLNKVQGKAEEFMKPYPCSRILSHLIGPLTWPTIYHLCHSMFRLLLACKVLVAMVMDFNTLEQTCITRKQSQCHSCQPNWFLQVLIWH